MTVITVPFVKWSHHCSSIQSNRRRSHLPRASINPRMMPREGARIPSQCGVARQRRIEKLRGLRTLPRVTYVDDTASDDGSVSDGSLSSSSSTASPSSLPLSMVALNRSHHSQVSKSSKSNKEEEKRRKLEARKIRNRESAALSRKRKADLITDLEAKVRLLEEENTRLRRLMISAGGSPSNDMPLPVEGVVQSTNIYKPAEFVN